MTKSLNEEFIFIDCQTTGASPKVGGRILEFAWCKSSCDADAESDVQSLIVRDDDEALSRRTFELTGINPGELAEAVRESELISRLADDKIAEFVAVTHFASFEKSFLLDLNGRTEQKISPPGFICTHKIAQRLFPESPAHGIRGIGGFLGLDTSDLKRSKCHVLLTMQIWKLMVPRLNALGINSVPDLEEWISSSVQPKRKTISFPLDSSKVKDLPKNPGIYRFHKKNGDVLYVGKATALRTRVMSYFRLKTHPGSRKREMLSQAYDISHQICASALEAALLETDEIKRLNPPYNVSLKIRSRELCFYDREFSAASNVQDGKFMVGPFPGPRVLHPFLCIVQGCISNEFSGETLFQELDPFILRNAVQIFLQKYQREMSHIQGGRQLMSLGLIIHRKRLRELAARLLAAKADEANEKAAKEKSANEKAAEIEIEKAEAENAEEMDLELSEMSAEELALVVEDYIESSARYYLRSRFLTRLLNSSVTPCPKSKPLIFRRGKPTSTDHHLDSTCPWFGLGLPEYDRMSVLSQEIARLKLAYSIIESSILA